MNLTSDYDRSPPGAPVPILPSIMSAAHIELFDLNPIEVARQITLIEFRLFQAIQVVELQEQRWNSAEKDTLCPNVMVVIRRFNMMSNFVQSQVVRVANLEARVALIERLLEVCVQLYELRNYNSLWEVMSGLRSSAVKRLTDTWDALSEQSVWKWGILCSLLETSSNFKVAFANFNFGCTFW
jgi:son of sevenless-like protein